MSNNNIASNLKKKLRGDWACRPEYFLKVPSYNSPTLRKGKGKVLSEGKFGKLYRGSINNNGRRYVAYKEIDTSKSIDGAFEFEFKVAQKLKEFAVPKMYLYKNCPIETGKPKKIHLGGMKSQPLQRTKPKDMIYMELLDSDTFNKWWQTNPSLAAIKSVIIQVINNLYLITQKYPDFRHHDIHGGNVMVGKGPEKQYSWKVGKKEYEISNAGVNVHIIDFGLSHYPRIKNPETSRGGYEYVGIPKDGPAHPLYDIHIFLYTIFAKVREPGNNKERAIHNFIKELIPNREFLEYSGEYTKTGRLTGKHEDITMNIPSFKVILTHPFLTDLKKPSQLAAVLKGIPNKAKTPPKTQILPPRDDGKLSTANRKKAMNNMIKKAAAVLAANKAKPALRRPGIARPNPVPKIKTVSPKAPYKPVSSSVMKELNGGKVNKSNKGPVRLKEKFSFVDRKDKKCVFARKFAYDRALAKNVAERKSGIVNKKLTPKAPIKEKEIVDLYMFTNMKGKEHMYKSKAWYEKALAKNRDMRNKDISRATATAVVAVGEVAKLQLKKKFNAKNYAMSDSMIRDLRKLNN